MPGHSEEFPWPSYYGNFDFFEDKMRNHSKVLNIKSTDTDGVYEITRTQGDTLRTFICECYAYGVAQYTETIEELGQLDAIVINSMWCGYSSEAKKLCVERNVSLYKVDEFMSALHRQNHWNYPKKIGKNIR